MIYPMMVNVDFTKIKDVGQKPKGLCITLVINWLIKPFTMAALGIVFFEYIFTGLVSPQDAKEYIAGMILLGVAPCTAMVFVWSQMVKGDANYTLVQVSVNDIIIEHEEFDILPASEKLANNKNIQTLLEAPKSRERLGMMLDELDKDYDYIIVDTPPSLNVLTDNALVATGHVVIPVIPEKLNANSLQIFAKQLGSLEPAYGDINRLAIVCNRVEQNSEHRDTIAEIKSAYSLPVFEIPKRTDLSQSIGKGVSVFGFAKENKRVEDARELFNEIADLFDETFEKTAPEGVKA
jgi:chromosome partitioning protein